MESVVLQSGAGTQVLPAPGYYFGAVRPCGLSATLLRQPSLGLPQIPYQAFMHVLKRIAKVQKREGLHCTVLFFHTNCPRCRVEKSQT